MKASLVLIITGVREGFDAQLTDDWPDDGIEEGAEIQIAVRVPANLTAEALTLRAALHTALGVLFEEHPKVVQEFCENIAAQAIAKAAGDS